MPTKTILRSPCRSTRRWHPISLLIVLVASLQCGLLADAVAQPGETANSPSPSTERSREMPTPRASMVGYLEACRSGDYESAARFMNLTRMAASERDRRGTTLARELKSVLDRKLWVQLDLLSGDPEGATDDGLPPRFDRVGTIETSRGGVDVLLERTAGGEAGAWLISASTVERIPELYEEFGYGALGEYLPDMFFQWRFLEIQLWQWIGLLLLVFVAYVASWVIGAVLVKGLHPLVARTQSDLDDQIFDAAAGPMRLVIAVFLFAAGRAFLGLAVVARDFFSGAERIFGVAAVALLLLRLVDVFSAVIEKRMRDKNMTSVHAVLPLGRRTAKAVLIILAFIALLQNLGVNVSGLIAGLGIGGLAFALAAQKTIENLFGGATIIADQPVRVGDFCRFGDKVGTVEDIGLRSTRVRTLDRTVITVPNAEFSATQLENFAKRDRIRLNFNLGVRYETTADQLRYLLIALKRLLVSHPSILPDPARVRFVGFGSHSLDLEIFCYVGTRDWAQFLAIREDIFLRIMDAVEESGTDFAFPTQTLLMGRDPGLDADTTTRVAQQVQAWRENGELPLPDPTPEMVAELDDSLDYPSRGSVSAS